jgi:hypothetical protein
MTRRENTNNPQPQVLVDTGARCVRKKKINKKILARTHLAPVLVDSTLPPFS